MAVYVITAILVVAFLAFLYAFLRSSTQQEIPLQPDLTERSGDNEMDDEIKELRRRSTQILLDKEKQSDS